MNWLKKTKFSPASLGEILAECQVDREALHRAALAPQWDSIIELVREHRDSEIRRWLGGAIDENLCGRAQAYESLRRDLISFKEGNMED